MSKAIQDSIFINSERNRLVHNNFASFSLSSSMDDIWGNFESAKQLPDWLRNGIEALTEAHRSGDAVEI